MLNTRKIRNFKLINRLYSSMKWIAERKGTSVISVLVDFCEDGINEYFKKIGVKPSEEELVEICKKEFRNKPQ